MAGQNQLVSVPNSELKQVPDARPTGRPSPGQIAEVAVFVRPSASAGDVSPDVDNLGGQSLGQRRYVDRSEVSNRYGGEAVKPAACRSGGFQ